MNIGERLSAGRLKRIASLTSRKYRAQYGQSIVEGFRSVRAAVNGHADIQEVVVTSDALAANRSFVETTLANRVPVYLSSQKDFERISGVETAQGMLAVVGTRWFSIADLVTVKRVVALDAVQDPGNVGTIVRTAAWFGIRGVIAAAGTADIYSPKVLRASTGGTWDCLVAKCAELPPVLQSFRENGYRVVAADMQGTDITGWIPNDPTVLVLGNEGSGLSGAVRGLVDDTVTIRAERSTQATESLNVATAAAVIMHRWSSRAERVAK